MLQLSKGSKLVRLSNGVAAGTTDPTVSTVDTAGFNGCYLIFALGAITTGAVTSVKAQMGDASNGSDAADIAGSKVTFTDADDNKQAVIDIYRPKQRYITPYIDRGTQNAVVDGVWALLYSDHKEPVTQDTTSVGTTTLVSPALGTA